MSQTLEQVSIAAKAVNIDIEKYMLLQIMNAVGGGNSGYPVGSTMNVVQVSGVSAADLQANVNITLNALNANVFNISSPAVDPTDIAKTFVLITYFV